MARWGEGGGAQLQLVELACHLLALVPMLQSGHGQHRYSSPGVRTWRGDRHRLGGSPWQPPPCPRPLRAEAIGWKASSVGLAFSRTGNELATAMAQLTGPALCEAFVPGRECTVPWVLGQVLPVVEITPASGLYDHEAKYLRDDTVFTVEPGLDPEVQAALEEATTQMASSMDARHLAADFILALTDLCSGMERHARVHCQQPAPSSRGPRWHPAA